jgi:hypothetical protein
MLPEMPGLERLRWPSLQVSLEGEAELRGFRAGKFIWGAIQLKPAAVITGVILA